MGYRKNISQWRGIPFPVGIPAIQFVPYSFGNMKPLHVAPFTVDLTISFSPFATIFVPANTWGDFKLMYLKLGFASSLVGGHDVSPAIFNQYYNVNPTSSVWIGMTTYDSPLPALGRGVLEYKFIRIGNNIFDYGSYQLDCAPLLGSGIAQDRYLQANGNIGTVDFTSDFEFQQLIDVAGALAGDTVTVEWAQAFIQSPLDLGRLPR